MLWYEGSIAEAVNLSKQRNAIFVVFVEGEDELSNQLAQVISSEAITSKLRNKKNFLNIKLQSGSVNYTHFARLYQFVPVPSLFFLGQNGTPLEVVGSGIAEENLSNRIDKILEEHRKTIPSLSTSTTSVAKEQSKSLIANEATIDEPNLSAKKPSECVLPADMPSTSSVVPKTETRKNDEAETSSGPATKIQKTHHEITKLGQEYEVVCNDDVCVRVPKKPDDDAATSASTTQPPPHQDVLASSSSESLSTEERAERARILLEARRAEKAREEIEAEKARELERRSRGQGVADLRRWQQDQEMKQLQEERRRDRLSEELARQRVLAQIAQDREERRQKEAAQATPTSAQPQTPVESQQGTSTPPRSSTGQARIVLKLPDGSAHTVTMRDDDTLATLRQYVDDNLHMPSATYSLWTAFPRRELVEDDASLLSLSLAPSAAVLVLTAGRATGEVRESGQKIAVLSFLSTIFSTFILDPTYRVWGWVQGIIFPQTTPTQPRSGTTTTATGTASNIQTGLRYRPRNNIHSLPGERPEDDDNNTWNGNSTQQM